MADAAAAENRDLFTLSPLLIFFSELSYADAFETGEAKRENPNPKHCWHGGHRDVALRGRSEFDEGNTTVMSICERIVEKGEKRINEQKWSGNAAFADRSMCRGVQHSPVDQNSSSDQNKNGSGKQQ
jgi:hypothetical protein